MSELAEKFLSLFSGCEGAHGQTNVLGRARHGKQQAKYEIVREPLTVELVQDHLDGKLGVGSIPIDETNNCLFGALDIDDYNLDLPVLLAKIKRFKLPLVLCRSKSGGAHLFLFLSEKVAASEVRDRLAEFASVLGWGNCEIFPKQEEVIVERGDVGNFINLPYQNAKYTTRYALKEDGGSLTLDSFLDLAASMQISAKGLANVKISSDKAVLPDGPPCLQQLTEFGTPEGGRNMTLLNVGVYYKQAAPNDWKELLEKHNQDYCSPPLPAREVVIVQEQLEKKEYFYTCKSEPLHGHCNKSLCRSRKFGVGDANSHVPVGGLTVVESEPPVWFIDVDGARLELSTKQLQMQVEFQRACMEQMYKMPAKMKEADWRDLVDRLLSDATRISVPEELTQKGLFVELVENFCTSRIQAHTPEELLTGKPWTEEGVTYFKLSSLQDFLKRNGFTQYTRGQITERLKEMNSGGTADKTYRFRDNDDNWKSVRVWFVPEMNRGEVDFPEVTFKPEEPPF
jgi:hypothetical protein|tara:strand:- start:11158 stop:12693 length:1536 start_codon:yes stop_codon:yes gene_type:complete